MAYIPICYFAHKQFRKSISEPDQKENEDFFIYSIVNKFDYKRDQIQKEGDGNHSQDFLNQNNPIVHQSQNPQGGSRKNIYCALDLEMNDVETQRELYIKNVKKAIKKDFSRYEDIVETLDFK